MTKRGGRAWLGAFCAAIALAGAAAPAQADFSDPLFLFTPPPPPPFSHLPPPTGFFNGPCGLAVNSSGNFYVSDYYHHTIDIFDSNHGYVTQLANEDPLDGPCGLTFGAASVFYVNNYHRNVVRFATFSAGAGTVIAGAPLDSAHPTGVGVNQATGDVYIDERTYVAVHDSAGNPVLDEGEPLRIGLGTLADAYGLAVSQFPGTAGRLYVADAATNTVKVYNPFADKVNPVAAILGPPGGFISLRDSAVAVDRVSGEVYVADNLQPQSTEQPQATIDVFDATGAYEGHLKYNVVDALPPGLAVDNSAGATQGRVYVTTGNANKAGVYAYPPGAATNASPTPAVLNLGVGTSGTGGGRVTSAAAGLECTATCEEALNAGALVSLTATPDSDSAFAGWSGGGCSGTGACTVTMSGTISLSAEFEALPSPPSPSEAQRPAAAAGVLEAPRHRFHRHRARRHPSISHHRHARHRHSKRRAR